MHFHTNGINLILYIMNKTYIYFCINGGSEQNPIILQPQFFVSIATRLIHKYNIYLIQLPVEQTGHEYTRSTEDPHSQYPAHWPRVH